MLKLTKGCLLGVGICFLSTGVVFAATTDFEQQQNAKRQEEQQQAQINTPKVQVQGKMEKSELVVLPKEPYRFPIKHIVVKAENTSRFAWLHKELAPYEGRLIGAQGINLLTKMVNSKLMERGFVTTSVSVPQQNLKEGTLTFVITPGYIENIEFSNKKQYGTWHNAFPTGKGDILNVHDLEQGLEQMKRVPNQDVSMSLKPGRTSNQSIVLLDVKRTKNWSAGMSFDDSGLENTGKLQVTGNIALYNPTGLNDILRYSYGKDMEHQDSVHGTKNYSLAYSIPYGNYTFSVNKYYNEFYQTVPTLVPFESRGKSDNLEISVQRLLYRDQTRRTLGFVKFLRRDKRNYIDGEELKIQRLKTTAYQLGLMHRQYEGQTVIDTSLYYQKGMPWLNAEPGLFDHEEDMLTTRYGLYGLNFYLATPVKLGKVEAQYSLTMRGQYTTDVLYAADQFSIGGRYTVRGFDGEESLSGENGFILRNELVFPFKKINLQPYLGIDYGRVWGPSDEYQVGNSLAGAVLGIRGKLINTVSYDLFIGAPLYKPEGFHTGKTACGFNLYWQF